MEWNDYKFYDLILKTYTYNFSNNIFQVYKNAYKLLKYSSAYWNHLN